MQANVGGLKGAAHGRHDDQLDLLSQRELGLEMLLQITALLLAKLRELRIRNVIFLCSRSAASSKRSRGVVGRMIDIVKGFGVPNQNDRWRHGV
jgi:hypothetical protein